MSTFAVPVVPLDDVQPHPDADRLDLAVIGGYRAVVPRGVFQKGELAIYVPEGAIVPDWILETEGLVGKLAGSAKNRVKAIRLRGVLSQGLVLQLGRYPQCGTSAKEDVSLVLGITKFEPPVPVHMAGEMMSLQGFPIAYDIENRKRFPNVLRPDELVQLTEKIHGTFVQIGWSSRIEPNPELFGDGRVFIGSKGLSAKGLVFKNNQANAGNLYVRTMAPLADRLAEIAQIQGWRALYILGEIFGEGVQDLGYGQPKGSPAFRAFDVFVDNPQNPSPIYASRAFGLYQMVLQDLGVESVPALYEGYWENLEPQIAEIAKGSTTLIIDPKHIREGVVIRPLIERYDAALGRVILKEISEDYLLRKNGTELT